MANAFFDQHHAAVRAAYARGLGGLVGAFEGGQAVVVERPAENWGYLASAVTFAMGTLVAVAPELRDFATTNTPVLHREAADRAYLEQIRAEAVHLGLAEAPEVFSGDILWALSSAPSAARLPVGLRFEDVSREWLNDQIAAGRFENGAGTPGASAREQRNRYGIALLDRGNDVIALAGVFDTYGLSEIGVDVVEAQQGRGLGAAVVSAALRAILERGETPLYGCSRTNIRSQRTALACGFLPVCAEGAVV
jgi:hypothetical protein